VKKILLNIYVWPLFVLVNIISLILLPILLGVNFVVLGRPRAQFIRHLIRIHGWVLVKLVPFMAPFTLEDRSGGFSDSVIFVANHSSSVDPYVFGLLDHENAFMTSWPFSIPIYSKIMRMAEYICTEDGWEAISQKGRRLLGQGCSVIVWPEGHRSDKLKINRFKKGAFQLAYDCQKKVVPVCIVGTGKLLSPGARLLQPSRVKMILLPPISPSDAPDGADPVTFLRNKTRESLENTVAQFAS
jgi:1-acyl-sn-glycerol-3-phosphate acyltransferase